MRPHSTLSTLGRKLTAARLALLFLTVTLCAVGLVSGTAGAPQDAGAEEREFKSTVPEHVPIRVKLKNEQSFKRRENKDWARELEVEVRNTGAKPIYYLYVVISAPDTIIGGHPLGFRVKYGRKELAFLDTPLEPEDVPIQPGESITLKIRDSAVRGYEEWRDKEKKPDPKKVEFDLQIINFGDGTGLRGRDDRPYLLKKSARNEPRIRGGGNACQPAPEGGAVEPTAKFLEAFYSPKPARFLRANFYPADTAPALASADLCGCQNSNDCMWGS